MWEKSAPRDCHHYMIAGKERKEADDLIIDMSPSILVLPGNPVSHLYEALEALRTKLNRLMSYDPN